LINAGAPGISLLYALDVAENPGITIKIIGSQ
jgi:hypothetical protein